MKNLMRSIPIFVFIFSGCASLSQHEHARGSVVALDSPTVAHVCMNSSEVKQGEQLPMFQIVCTSKKMNQTRFSEGTESTTCTKVSRGMAEVIENSSLHFIKIKAMTDATIQVGYIIEKIIR